MHLLKSQMEEVIRLLNLIKNEYAKIFHKKSSYILLGLLIVSIIGLPLLYKFVNSQSSNDTYYYNTYEEEIRWAEESNDYTYAAELKKAEEIGLSIAEFYNKSDWRSNALDTIYYSYWDMLNSESPNIETSEKKIYKNIFDESIKYIEKNNWKGYYEFQLENIDTNPEYTDVQKKYEKFYYEYMLENNIKPCSGQWQEEALNTYKDYSVTYEELKAAKDSGETYDETEYATAERNVLISKYRLDNNISAAIYEGNENEIYSDTEIYVYTGELYNNMKNSIMLLMIVMLIIIIIAGGIISKEFSQGTIKFLLINPVKRNKIFWSKYLTVFSYAFLLTALTFVLSFIMSVIVYGTSELNTQMLTVEAGKIIAHSAPLFMISRYLLSFVELLVAFTIAFMISSLFRNSALAITISMIIYFVGSTVCELAALFNLDFFRYTIFAVQNLTSIVNGKSSFLHITTEFAIAVIAVHIFLLLLTAHDAFTKKNV